MADRDVRERDILVASNEYAYVQDLTKGDIVLYVGPTKISLSNTERLVELRADRFVPVRSDEGGVGVAAFVSASSAQYVVLENPVKDAAVRPVKGSNSAVELLAGRRVVVPGPASFPLWPGQKARVVNGHELYEDQYLRVRVYDAVEGEAAPIGTERIVKGSDVSFYIPKTGLEVVPEGQAYVRNAVTLTDGQFCILRGPKGRRRYVRGPGVVFPEAWEELVVRNGARAFAAFPLRKDKGLHLRVLKGFEAKAGEQVPAGRYQAGQELFIEGRDGFFFPTEELEVLGEVRAICLAEKEAIYVRDIATGRIRTVVGPCAFLADPTKEEVVTRELSEAVAARYGLIKPDPRRAPAISIPPSFAVLVTGKTRREVVKGPQVRILDYDEELGTLALSTGTPKTNERVLTTSFVLVDGNKVSDALEVRTADHVQLSVRLSYRVSFHSKPGADDARWFNVNDYVALLCDHLGSLVRAAVRRTSVDRFHAQSTDLIRTAILGERTEQGRAGREFEENGLLVYDVEVLEVRILDEEVQELLSDAQRSAIASEVGRRREELRLMDERAKETVNRAVFDAQRETIASELLLEAGRRDLSTARAEAKAETARIEVLARAKQQADALGVSSAAEAQAAARRAEVDQAQLAARTAAFKEQMAALHPELVATLKALGNQQLAAALTENLSPLAILGGESVTDVAQRLLSSLPVGPSGADAGKVVQPLKRSS
jgi:major vault protein